MKGLLSLAFLVLASTFSFAQDKPPSNCPMISVSGPAGLVDVGELASYTATVSNAERYSLEYVWSVSAGRIKDGQGTSSIRVIQPTTGVTVTVDVKGVPEGCPTSASEMAIYDRAPEPTKIYELRPNKIFEKEAAMQIAAVMLENPNNQLYILAGDVERKDSPSFQTKRQSIIDLLTTNGIPRDQLTVALVYSDVELYQFWQVPPGAVYPRCEECEKAEAAAKQCPMISIEGPPGVPLPKETILFTAKVSGYAPKELKYSWLISTGTIVGGQGSDRIRVEVPYDREPITATVEVTGLDGNCVHSAAQSAPVCECGDPLLLDEFASILLREQVAKIDDAVRELRVRKRGKLVFIEYFSNGSSITQINTRLKWVTTQLQQRHRLRSTDFEIITTPDSFDGARHTKIYFIPSSVPNPVP